MNKMNYDLTKFRTGDLGVCFGTSAVDKLIWSVEELEVLRLGLPKNIEIPEHIFYIVAPFENVMFTKRSANYILLKDNVYVFEDKIDGCEFGLLTDRYPQTANVVYIERVNPFSNKAVLAGQNRAIEGFIKSFAYGWLNFIYQIPHVLWGASLKRLRLIGSEICSQFAAACDNDSCRADNEIVDFANEETTNPLEVWINKNFKVKKFD